MTLDLECPACGKAIVVEQLRLGQAVRCLKCGAGYSIHEDYVPGSPVPATLLVPTDDSTGWDGIPTGGLSIAGQAYCPAGWISRSLARVCDNVIAMLPFIASLMLSDLSAPPDEMAPRLGAFLTIFYFLFADGFKGGQSLGKRLLNIAVIDATSGSFCTYRQSFSRGVPLALLGGLEFLFVIRLLGKDGRRLGDTLADTIVVHARGASASAPLPPGASARRTGIVEGA